jgi:hypothetical protein
LFYKVLQVPEVPTSALSTKDWYFDVESKNVLSSILGIVWIVSEFYATCFTSATSFYLGLNDHSCTDFSCNRLCFFGREANFAWYNGYAVPGEQFFGLVFV